MEQRKLRNRVDLTGSQTIKAVAIRENDELSASTKLLQA